MEGKLNLVCCLSVFCLAILTYRISDYESESQPKRYGDSCAKYLADNISGTIEEEGTQPKIQNTKYVPSGEFLWSRGRALSPLGSRSAVDLRWCCDSGLVGLRGLFGLFSVCHRAIKINSSSWKVTGGPLIHVSGLHVPPFRCPFLDEFGVINETWAKLGHFFNFG